MPRLRKTVSDDLLLKATVHDLDPDLPLLASQAGMLLSRSKTRMDSDRREGRGSRAYKDEGKIFYRLGDVLAERTRIYNATLQQVAPDRERRKRGW